MKNKPISHLLWGIFLFLISTQAPLLAQRYTVKGKVIDGETGEAIPFGNVYPKSNPSGGTTTDFDGYFTLLNVQAQDTILVSYIGYEAKSKWLDPSKALEGTILLNFQLLSSNRKLDDIVVLAGEDPAYPIMREVIKHKKDNDLRQLDAYEYESYVKIELDIDNISDKFTKRKIIRKIQQTIDSVGGLTGEDGESLIPLFLSESISQFYYRNDPERKTEKVIKTKIDGIGLGDDSPVNQLLGSTFQQYNFYNNWMPIVSKDFVSPLADAWKLYYDYYLADSVQLGPHWCYRIEVYPKRPQDLAFEGMIWIDSKSYGLKQIDVKVSKSANINFIERVRIQQELKETEAGPWLPIKNRVLVDVGELTKNSAGLLAKFYTSNEKVKVNKVYPIKFYRDPLSVETDAQDFDANYWNEHRHDSLSKEEIQTYALIDSIKQVPIVKTYSDILKVVATGYVSAGPIDFGNWVYTYAFNNVEGQRIRMGLRTNTDFSKKIELKGYLAYGSKDNRFKYWGRLRYIPSRKRWTEIVAERRDDIVQVAANPDGVFVPGAFVASLNFFDVASRSPFYRQENIFYIKSELFKGFTQTVRFRNSAYQQIGNHFAYFKNLEPTEASLERNFRTSEISFETRLAKGEKFFHTGNQRFSLGTQKLPVLTLKYTLGLDNIWGGDFNYHKFGFSLEQSLRLGLLGNSYYLLSGSYTPSTLPYPLLEVHLGNQGFFYNFYGYSLMDFLEFVSDRHLSFNFEHNFEGLISNRLPLLKKLKWRTFVAANILYGDLGTRNQAIIPAADSEGNPLIKPNGLGNRPYIELGYGLSNIFKFFRVTLMHRLTYRENENARKFGVFVSARFKL